MHDGTVNELIDSEGGWNTDQITNEVDNESIISIHSTILPSSSPLEDTLFWKGAKSGSFTVAAAYEAMKIDVVQSNSVSSGDWIRLWKLRVPNKLICFIWTGLHGKILTNTSRKSRNMTDDDTCTICGNDREDQCHLFLHCPKVRNIWVSLLGNDWLINNNYLNFRIWILKNIKTKRKVAGLDFCTLFVTAVWNIWLRRNKFVFNNILETDISIVQRIKHQTLLTQGAFLSRPHFHYFNLSKPNSKWSLPVIGKLNVDGCVRMTQDNAGFGGVFRNNKGDWTFGYMCRLRGCTSLESEIWSIYRGVAVAYQKNWINLEIESDSLEAVQIFHDEKTGPTSMMTQIMEGKCLIRRIVGRIKHVSRDANEVANALANLGAEQNEQLVLMEEAPDAVKGLIIADKMGIGMYI